MHRTADASSPGFLKRVGSCKKKGLGGTRSGDVHVDVAVASLHAGTIGVQGLSDLSRSGTTHILLLL